jgi:hypothetical protein
MSASRLRIAGLAVVATIGLSGCAYGGPGYGGVNVGYGGYNDPYYGGYGYPAGYGYPGYGYGYPTYGYRHPGYYGSIYPGSGWYNGYWWPGTGYYVYRDGRPYRWDREQSEFFKDLKARAQAAANRGETLSTQAVPVTRQSTVQRRSVREAIAARQAAREQQVETRRESRGFGRVAREAVRRDRND